MELDKRIIEGKKPLDCFDAEIAKQFIGKKGFFGTHESQFMNLDTCPKCVVDELKKVDNYDDCPFISKGGCSYRRFLPCEWVKEEESALKHIDFEAAKNDKNFELCKLYGEELLFDTKNNIFYTSDGNIHGYLTAMAKHRAQEEQTEDVASEKKYRAFTLNEFLERYKIGNTVTFRLKKGEYVPEAECLVEYKRMITGYESLPEDRDKPGKGSILLGGCPPVSLARLFEFYELDNDFNWQPFGIEEEE